MRYIALLILLLPLGAVAAERVERYSIPVNPDVRFSLTSQRGMVDITTGDVDTIEMVVTIRHEDVDILELVEIDVNSSPAFVRTAVNYEEPGIRVSFGFIGINDHAYPEIHFRITLPDQASLKVDSHRSELDIQAPAGRLEIASHRGSGRLANVRNDLNFRNHRGNFRIDVSDLHDVDLATHRGDMELHIFGADDFTLVGEAHRSDIRFIGKDITQQGNDSGIHHVEGSGRDFISFDAHRSNMRINFRQ